MRTRQTKALLVLLLVLVVVGCAEPPSGPGAPRQNAVPAASQVGYQIDLYRYDDDAEAFPHVLRAARNAATKWESALRNSDPWDVTAGRLACDLEDDRHWIPPTTIDDIAIFIVMGEIDGAGGTWGRAGPCVVRYRGFLPPWETPPLDFMPALSIVQLDTVDVRILHAAGRTRNLEDLILHEMGHALGVGSYGWSAMSLLQNPADRYSGVYQDSYFSGWRAIRAFDSAGGTDYLGPKVPVENEAWSIGSRNGHWRESIMGTELMTPWISDGSNPLSRITLASLADLGYAVEPGQADTYTLPAETSIDMDKGELIHVGQDLHQGPLTWVGRDGTTVTAVHLDLVPASRSPRKDQRR